MAFMTRAATGAAVDGVALDFRVFAGGIGSLRQM